MEKLNTISEFTPTNNNWILMINYNEIINHSNRQIFVLNNNQPVEKSTDMINSPNSIMHVFFNYMTEHLLIALVLTVSNQYLLISNKVNIEESNNSEDPTESSLSNNIESKTEDETIKLNAKVSLPVVRDITSKIYIISKPEDLINRLIIPNSVQKLIGINKWHKNWNKLPVLPLINFSSFWNLNSKNMDITINNWIINSGSELNFTNQYYLNHNHLKQIATNNTVKTLKLNQNCQITEFDWLSKFTELKHLIIEQCQQIDNDIFNNICKYIPKIEQITLKYCCSMNIRILLFLSKLNNIERLVIDYPNFYCQISPKEVIISKNEWKSNCSYSIKSILINSTNVTLDIVDYLIKSYPNLTDLCLDENILQTVGKNMISNSINENDIDQTNILNFHVSSDTRKGFRAARPITFKNMFKNYITAPFSKSMIEKIKKQNNQNDLLNLNQTNI